MENLALKSISRDSSDGITPSREVSTSCVTPDALLVVDDQGVIVHANEGLEAAYGHAPQALVGRPLSDLVADLTLPNRLDHAAHVQVRTADGAIVAAQVTSTALSIAGARRRVLSLRPRSGRYDALSAHARRQETLAELGHQALGAPDLDGIFNAAIRGVAARLRVDHACLFVACPEEPRMSLRAGRGWCSDRVGELSGAGERELTELLPHHGLQSSLSVSAASPSGARVLLGVQSAERRGFTNEDRAFLQSVAALVATALERRAIEDRGHERDEQLLDAQALGNLGSFDWCAHDDRLTTSAGIARICGTTPSTLEELLTFIEPARRDDVRRAFSSAAAPGAGRTLQIEAEVLRPNGARRTVQILGRARPGLRGGVGRISAVCHDVTEERQTDRALRESEARYRDLVELAPDLIAVYAAGRLLYLNPAGARILELGEPEHARGRALLDFIHPEHRDTARTRVLDRLEIGTGQQRFVERVVLCSGRERHVEFSSTPLIHDGEPAWQLLGRDVTDRARAEQALRTSEERFRLAVNSVQDYAIILLDPQGRVAGWNDGAARMTGYQTDAIIGAYLARFYPEETVGQQLPERLLREAMLHRRAEFAGDVVRSDGSTFIAQITMNSMWDDDGQLCGFIQVTRDLTAQRRAEDAMLRRTKLERAVNELEQFAYAASHDLREPLRTMSVFLQLLDRGYGADLPPRAREFIGFAVEGSRRMHRLLDGILEYSRAGADRVPIRSTSLETILEEARSNLRAAIDESGAEITADALPYVQGDAAQLLQLFQNLLCNAIKFRREGPPHIHVSAARDDMMWRVSISDDGIGIHPLEQERVFRMFQRLHERDAYPGTGLGLTICKRIVEWHGGQISIASEPGQGTTFHFTLPVDTTNSAD